MILFSSLYYPIIFMMFSYLGFLFGIIFAFFEKLTNNFFNKKGFLVNSKIKNNKRMLIDKQNKKERHFLKKFGNLISQLFLSIIFFVMCIVTFLINLNLNYGVVRIFYIFVWIIFFLLGKTVFKKLAILILNFYNKTKKRQKT